MDEYNYSMQTAGDVSFTADNKADTMEHAPSPESEYKPKAIQTVAALLMAIPSLFMIIFPFIYFNYLIDGYEENAMERFRLFMTLSELLIAIGFALLIPVACNKAVKVATISLMCLIIFEECLHVAIFNHILQMSEAVGYIVDILIQLGYIYLFALIINNCSLSTTNRSWINLICVVYAMVVLHHTILWQESFNDAVDLDILQKEDDFLFSSLYTYFWYLLRILMIVTYWNFARCEAFNGQYDKDYKCNFLPLNKWMAMAVIAPFVTGVALYLYYKILSITLQ